MSDNPFQAPQIDFWNTDYWKWELSDDPRKRKLFLSFYLSRVIAYACLIVGAIGFINLVVIDPFVLPKSFEGTPRLVIRITAILAYPIVGIVLFQGYRRLKKWARYLLFAAWVVGVVIMILVFAMGLLPIFFLGLNLLSSLFFLALVIAVNWSLSPSYRNRELLFRFERWKAAGIV